MSENCEKSTVKWHHPSEVMRLHNLKVKKRALQARINGNKTTNSAAVSTGKLDAFEEVLQAKKRKNPFIKSKSPKRTKTSSPPPPEESSETLLNLLSASSAPNSTLSQTLTFANILSKVNDSEIVVVKGDGVKHPPIDWSLKSKMRLLSSRPFPWKPHRLKISEEASGTTGFVRCLETATSDTKLDMSPNSNFYQCCHYWQHPALPWLTLFPRKAGKTKDAIPISADMRNSLQIAWSDSLRSLFHLVRTRQCPYFYLCSNNFTVLIRAAGMCGFGDVHALITPTTRGFREVLRSKEIDFTTPLQKTRTSDIGQELPSVEEVECEENWLKSMGIDQQDIKRINYTQEKINHKSETEMDNRDESLVMIEGVHVSALYNFLLNSKSVTSSAGLLAGIPPTLLAPVAFNSATLSTLKVRENKITHQGSDFYSLELTGPVLPTIVHSLFAINEQDTSATFSNVASTEAFNKITATEDSSVVFNRENLLDAGLPGKMLDYLCRTDVSVTTLECLKYNSDTKTFTWT